MNVTDMSTIYKWVDGKDLHIDKMSSNVYRLPISHRKMSLTCLVMFILVYNIFS
jgi:hypothetical protein